MDTIDQDPDKHHDHYPIDSEHEQPAHRSWPMLLALAIAALAFAFLVVLGGRFVYHKLHHTVTPAPAQTQKLPKPPTGSGTSSNSSTSSSSTNSQLPNSGPGDVVAIFALSSFAAASLHYVISLRKQV